MKYQYHRRISMSPAMNSAFKPVIISIVWGMLFFVLGATAHASYWSECHFEVEVIDISETHVTINPLRFIRGDGTAMPDKKACLEMIGDRHVPVEAVKEGVELLAKGARLYGVWSRYGGMTPSGPVSYTGWTFTPINDDV